MPRVFKAVDIEKEEKEVMRDYLDRHMPHVICADQVQKRREIYGEGKDGRGVCPPR
jgi:hypothetical protein